MKPRVLLLSAYAAASHQLWVTRLQLLFPEYAWTMLELPPRHFNWTIRGNSMLWAFRERELLQQAFDLLIATSMVDLSSLRGMVPSLALIPTLVYFHENQFAYPSGGQREANVEPQLVPLYAALCADQIVFNSHYNRDSFLQGAIGLFKRLPDAIPDSVLLRLQDSCVVPVPILQSGPTPATARDPDSGAGNSACGMLEIVWNHRWEYDKGTDLLLELCKRIRTDMLPMRLHIVGEQFRKQPVEFQQIDLLLNAHAAQLQISRGRFGFIAARSEYETLLAQCDVVLSTARHDFQGLAIQEACMLSCTPLAPNSLVYPEYLDSRFLYALGTDHPTTAAGLCARLQQWHAQKAAGVALPKADLQGFSEAAVRPQYAQLFQQLLATCQN